MISRPEMPGMPKIDGRKIMKGVIGVVVAVVLFVASFGMFEYLDAQHVMVIQSPFSGNLSWYTDQGVKFQWFGKVTKYKKSFQYWFSASKDQGAAGDQSIPVRFNDAGHGMISGSVRIDLPLDKTQLTALHVKYGSQAAIEHDLVRTNYEKAVYMAGPLLSSRESYAEKRPDLITFIEDQAMNGVYKTVSRDTKGKDAITGVEKTVTVVELVKDSKGGIARQEVSPFTLYGIKSSAFSINKVNYDKTVEEQIASQQKAAMQIQTAMVKAKEAEQEKLTVEAKGAADAAKAKWEQEVVKAKEVTAAEQRVRVAQLDAEAAALTKKKDILIGEGEGEKKRLAMAADGALEQKLRAWITVNEKYADAISKYQGAWVPSLVMGGTGGVGHAGSGATDMINLLSVKTAKDLALDMGFAGSAQTGKKK
jgi:hypothetical protein